MKHTITLRKTSLAEKISSLSLNVIGYIHLMIPNFLKTTEPFILCYHSVETSPSSASWRYSTDAKEFAKQMKYLKKNKKVVPLNTLLRERKKNTVAITFDDGYEDNVKVAAKIVQKLRIPVTLFVIGDSEKANRKELDNNKQLLSVRQIKKLQKQGWTIGFHTRTHAHLRDLSERKVRDEVIKGKKDAERVLKTPLTYLAYPRGGYTNDTDFIVAEAGFTAAFTVDGGPIDLSQFPFRISRVPMEASIRAIKFHGLITPMGLHFQKWYMSLLQFKEYRVSPLLKRVQKMTRSNLRFSKANMLPHSLIKRVEYYRS